MGYRIMYTPRNEELSDEKQCVDIAYKFNIALAEQNWKSIPELIDPVQKCININKASFKPKENGEHSRHLNTQCLNDLIHGCFYLYNGATNINVSKQISKKGEELLNKLPELQIVSDMYVKVRPST